MGRRSFTGDGPDFYSLTGQGGTLAGDRCPEGLKGCLRGARIGSAADEVDERGRFGAIGLTESIDESGVNVGVDTDLWTVKCEEWRARRDAGTYLILGTENLDPDILSTSVVARS